MAVKVVVNLLLHHFCLSHFQFRKTEVPLRQLFHNREGALGLLDS